MVRLACSVRHVNGGGACLAELEDSISFTGHPWNAFKEMGLDMVLPHVFEELRGLLPLMAFVALE